MTDLNPQAKQMADESMVRGLDAQARAIWPQEVQLLRRYALPAEPRILDAGCGTGEGASRLAELFPRASVLGVDIIDHHLELARSRYASFVPRLAFEHQSVFELQAADRSFDLSVPPCSAFNPVSGPRDCRACAGDAPWRLPAPHSRRLWHASLSARCARSAGFLASHCGKLWSGHRDRPVHWAQRIWDPCRPEPRSDHGGLRRRGYNPRAARNLRRHHRSMRDGYAEPIGELTPITREAAVAYFDQMIANIRNPHGYAVWMVPIVSARVGFAEPE
jgi:SAM-dependent methyltransferase